MRKYLENTIDASDLNNEDARVMFELHKKLLSNGIAAEKYIKDEFEWVRSFLTYKNLNDYIGKERVGRKIWFYRR